MTTLTTIKVSTDVQQRLRTLARQMKVSQAALIDQMLREREDAEFWSAMAAAPAPTTEELDEVDAAFVATALDGDL